MINIHEHKHEIYEKMIWNMKTIRNKLRDWDIDILFLILVFDTLIFDWYDIALLRYCVIIQYLYLHFNVTDREWEDQYKQSEWLFISYPSAYNGTNTMADTVIARWSSEHSELRSYQKDSESEIVVLQAEGQAD